MSEMSDLELDYFTVFKTEAGIRVLKDMMFRSGYKEPNLPMNLQTGEVMEKSWLFNEARRVFYLDIRKMIPAHILNKVERETEQEIL